MFDNLQVAREGPVALVTVNRPHVLNALNGLTLVELGQAADDLRRDAEIRAVIITGAGEKAFVAGADISELASLTAAQAQQHALLGQQVFDAIEQMGKPVIAAVNGFALVAGASWRWHARCGSPRKPRDWVNQRSIWGSRRGLPGHSGSPGWLENASRSTCS